MDSNARVELHCYTKNSEKQSVAAMTEYIAKMEEIGMTAIGFCGYGTVRDIINALVIGKRKGIKTVFSIELTVVDNKLPSGFYYRTMLIIKKHEAISKLFKILSINTLNQESDINFASRAITKEDLLSLKNDVFIVDVAGEGFISNIDNLISKDVSKALIDENIGMFDYAEVTPFQTHEEVMRVVDICDNAGIKIIASSKPAYISEKQKFVYDEMRDFFGEISYAEEKHFLMKTDEMLVAFNYLGREKSYEIVVANTNEIASAVYDSTPSLSTGERLIPKVDNADTRLKEICYRRLNELYASAIPEEKKKRVDEELAVIEETESAYMMLLHMELYKKCNMNPDIVSFRGYVCNSYVCYLCGITNIDPFKYNLNYEIAFGMGRVKRPVYIDINVSETMAKNAFEKADSLEGIASVYRPSDYRFLQDNKLKDEFIEQFMDKYFGKFEESELMEYVDMIKWLEFDEEYVSESRIVLVPEGHSIEEISPLIRKSGKVCTEFDYYGYDYILESMNLHQNQTVTILEKLFAMTEIKASDIKDDDQDILSLLLSPKALGIDEALSSEVNHGCAGLSEFDIKTVWQEINRLQINNFNDMVKLSCLLHGTGTWQDNTKELIDLGFITIKEAISNRDDVFEYCLKLGIDRGTSFAISEFVRKGRSNKRRREVVRKGWDEYEKLLKEHGADDWFIDYCTKVDYLFSRSHGISYIRMMWQLAYFKIHYPIQFYSVYFMTCKDQRLKLKLVQGGSEFEEYFYHIINRMDKRTDYDMEVDYREYRNALVAKEMFLRGYTYKDLIDIR